MNRLSELTRVSKGCTECRSGAPNVAAHVKTPPESFLKVSSSMWCAGRRMAVGVAALLGALVILSCSERPATATALENRIDRVLAGLYVRQATQEGMPAIVR
jgi:hypothetical protein